MTDNTDFEKKLTGLTNRNLSGEFEIELKDTQLQNRVCLPTAETFQGWERNLAFCACRASESVLCHQK